MYVQEIHEVIMLHFLTAKLYLLVHYFKNIYQNGWRKGVASCQETRLKACRVAVWHPAGGNNSTSFWKMIYWYSRYIVIP